MLSITQIRALAQALEMHSTCSTNTITNVLVAAQLNLSRDSITKRVILALEDAPNTKTIRKAYHE